jgi:hypothetical protein
MTGIEGMALMLLHRSSSWWRAETKIEIDESIASDEKMGADEANLTEPY